MPQKAQYPGWLSQSARFRRRYQREESEESNL
jgi:hypothetical protein